MKTKASDLVPQTTGNAGTVTYYGSNIQSVLAQAGAVSIKFVNVKVPTGIDLIDKVGSTAVNPSDADATAIFAVDSGGNLLNQTGHVAALPCPTFCNE